MFNFFLISSGGAFQGIQDTISPFGYKRGEGADAGKGDPEWIVGKERHKYDPKFESLNPVDGKITGTSKLKLNYHYLLFLRVFVFNPSLKFSLRLQALKQKW